MAAIVITTVLAVLLLNSLIRNTLPRFGSDAAQATRRAEAWVISTAVQQHQAINDAQHTLQTIAGLSSLQSADPARCRTFIVNQVERYSTYSNLGVVRKDGALLCSALPLALTVAQGMRLSEDAQRSGLGFLPNVDTGELLIGIPARGKVGTAVPAVVFAVLALPGLDGKPAEAGGAGDLHVELFTQSGLILARRPDRERLAGSTLHDVPLIGRAAESGGGSGKLAGADGVSRFYAFVPLDGPGVDRRYLAAGLPVAAVYAGTQRLLYTQLAALILLAAVIAVLAGAGSDRFLSRYFAALPAPSEWALWAREVWHRRPSGTLKAAIKLLQRLWTRLGRQLKRKRSKGDLERTIESLQLSAGKSAKLNDMTQLLQTCVSMEELHGVVARFAQELFPGGWGALFITSNSRTVMDAVVTWGKSEGKIEVFMPDDCWAVRLGKTHGSEDPQANPQCSHVAEFPPGGYLCVPMIVRGEVLGVLHLQYDSLPAPLEKSGARRQMGQTFAERIALALSNLQLTESLRAQSVRDSLTGLYNRRFLDETMEIEIHRAKRSSTPIGIIMIDIDHFKRFNDTYGHAAGDAVLRKLAEFMSQQVREEDIPCRYGGEEFIVVLPGATLEASHERAEALRSGCGRLSFDYQDTHLGQITLSLGVACWVEDGLSWQQTVKTADDALYRAKEQGRNRVVLAE